VYPKPVTLTVQEPSTLREFIAMLGEETLYTYDRRTVGVVVNGRRLWDSARLAEGDRVTIFPIIVGG